MGEGEGTNRGRDRGGVIVVVCDAIAYVGQDTKRGGGRRSSRLVLETCTCEMDGTKTWAQLAEEDVEDMPPPPGYEAKEDGNERDGRNKHVDELVQQEKMHQGNDGDANHALEHANVHDPSVRGENEGSNQEEKPGEIQGRDPTGRTEPNTTSNETREHVGESKIQQVLDDASSPYVSAAKFEDLGITHELLEGLYTEMKFERPSKIQSITLPMILKPPHKNLIAQAHNGSGKTTCFVLGMLSRVDANLHVPQAVCVCPTRELVLQNVSVLERMAKFTNIKVTHTAGGRSEVSRGETIQDQVVIGTPGTLRKWMSQWKVLPTKAIRILVFDEADQMLAQEGFGSDSTVIIRDIRKTSPHVQVLFFSATFNEKVKKFAHKQVPNANNVFIKKEELSLDRIKQYKVHCPDRDTKLIVLREIIFPMAENMGQTIIFTRTKATCRAVHQQLNAAGWKCSSVEGDMMHEDRDRVIKEFRDGTTKILIATSVLSRGFDHDTVTLVINYDMPVERDGKTPAYEDYLHRIGRSGRFGRKGAAFNLVYGDAEEKVMDSIASYFDHTIEEVAFDNEDAFELALVKAGLANKEV